MTGAPAACSPIAALIHSRAAGSTIMARFTDKVVLITGGSGGIGAEAARKFHAEGAKLVLVDIDEAALSEVAGEIGDNVTIFAADVTQNDQVAAYVKHAIDTFGKIDVFFNNAGVEGVVKPIPEYPEDVFDKVIAVNVKGVWLGLRHVMPVITDGGAIINTASVAGLSGTPNVSAYVASKHAVIGLTRVASLEGAARNIRVTSVHPSPVDNRMMRSLEEGFAPGEGEKMKDAFAAAIPLGRYATNEDIANGVLFLASDDAAFITGTKLVVDGGQTQF